MHGPHVLPVACWRCRVSLMVAVAPGRLGNCVNSVLHVHSYKTRCVCASRDHCTASCSPSPVRTPHLGSSRVVSPLVSPLVSMPRVRLKHEPRTSPWWYVIGLLYGICMLSSLTTQCCIRCTGMGQAGSTLGHVHEHS